jgi:RecB family exonuclease
MNRTVRLGGWGLVLGAGRTVITPNENAADTLDVKPLTLEDLAHVVLGEGRVANPVVVWRLMQEAVANALGGEDPDGLARAMLPAIRELFRATPETATSPASVRARRVFEVAEEYRRLLRESSLVDPAEVLWEATRECTSRIPLLVWGYPRFGRDELAFIDTVAAEDSEVRLPWGEDSIFGANLEVARELESRGWAVKEAPLKSVWKPAAAVEALEYPHLEAEVRGTLARVKALLVEGVPQDDIVIVARDDAFYGPTVLSVAKEYGVPVRLLYRVTVADTRVGAWLKMLFEAAEEGFPFEMTARLLAHPLGPGLSRKGWAEARRVRASGSAPWEECGVKLAHLDLPHIWPDEDSRAGWAGRFEELLRACDLRSRVGSARREIIALARLREAIGWLAEPQEEETSRERFIAEIFEAMSVTSTPAYPEGEGVALHTPLSLYGARYRHVFVLGLAEATLPAPVSEDPTLDFHERKLLKEEGIHLELAAERARRERLSFWTLLQVPRERLVLSYPKVVGSRASLASPYFELLEMEPFPPGPLPAASPEEARRAYLQREGYEDQILQHATRAWEVERRREGTDPFDLYDGVLDLPLEAGERHFSASQLADLLRCGFKWWAGSVLGLAEPDEGESPALLGWLYHKALESATRRCMEGRLRDLRSGMLGCLEEAFSEAEEEVEADRMRAWGVRRRLHLEVLRNAISQGDFILPEDEVVATEATFTGRWRGFELAGRVDRVDRTEEGLVFVDYKSGPSRPRPDVQLAIYREAAAEALFPGEKARDAYYYSLRGGERIKGKEPSEEELEELAEGIHERLRSGHLPPDVLERDALARACAVCSFDLVCRRGARLGRKLGAGPEEGGGGAAGYPAAAEPATYRARQHHDPRQRRLHGRRDCGSGGRWRPDGWGRRLSGRGRSPELRAGR